MVMRSCQVMLQPIEDSSIIFFHLQAEIIFIMFESRNYDDAIVACIRMT